MGWFSSIANGLSNLFSSGASKVASNAGSNLVSEVVVNGVRGGTSNVLGNVLSGVGSVALNSLLNNNYAQPKTSTAVTNVPGLVTAPQPVLNMPQTTAPDPADYGPATTDAQGVTDVSGLTAYATPAAAAPPPSLANLGRALSGALGAGAGALSQQQPALTQLAGNDNGGPTDVSELTVEAPPKQQQNDAIEALGGVLTDVPGLHETQYDALHNGNPLQSYDEEGKPTDKSGLLSLLSRLGISPKDALGLGLLGTGLLEGTKTQTGTNPYTDLLQTTATNNQTLINQLSQTAAAGQNGQIGGQGINAIKRMVRNAQAAIRQRYSGMNMSGSTAEAADLQGAVQQGLDMQFKIGQEQATAGLNTIAALTGQNANIYANLMNAQTAKDTALGNALANFAGAAASHLLKAA